MSDGRPIRQLDVEQAAAELGIGPAGSGAEPGDREREPGTNGPLPVLVDVREADEVNVIHVPGARHVPLSDFATTSAGLPRDRPLLLLCASGRRSLVAAEYLQRNGHGDVANVSGGITEWHRRGLPTASGPMSPGDDRDDA